MINKVRVEIPNSDAHRLLNSMAEVRRFLAHHGVGADEFTKEGDLVTVPAFAEGREKFIAAKLKTCQRWGCE